MAETKVSEAFEGFYAKEQEAIEKVKHEEARTADLPVDVGTQGICVVTDMSFDATPNAVDGKGVITKKGSPYCRVGLRIIDNAEHEGKRLQHTYFFWENEKTSRAENFKLFLDELENKFGLPREVRENHTHPKELGEWFQKNEHTIQFEIKAQSAKNTNEYNDGKRLALSQPKDIVPMTDDVVPPPRNSSAAPPEKEVSTSTTDTPAVDLKVGMKVMFEDQICTITDVFSTKIQLKGVEDPRFEKIVLKSAVSVA